MHLDTLLGELAIELAETTATTRSGRVQGCAARLATSVAHAFEVEHVAVSVVSRPRWSWAVAAATGPVAREAAETQRHIGEGPGVLAVVEAAPVVSHQVAADLRWPRWRLRAAELAIGGVMACSLHAGGRIVGVLDVFGSAGREFSSEQVEAMGHLARHASAALLVAHELDGLSSALESRSTIGQAQGIVMERYAVDADRAFAILRRHSQHENRPLRQVAADIVGSVVGDDRDRSGPRPPDGDD